MAFKLYRGFMIGFDIGGTKCAVSVGHEETGKLKIEKVNYFDTDHSINPYDMIEKLCAAAKTMVNDFDYIGISCGGPLDSNKGIIMNPPNLPGWDNIKIVDYIKDKFKCKVAIENDANACAVAEWKYGAGIGTKNMIFMTFGSGLGAGIIIDGKLYKGSSDMAGEFGHVRLEDNGPVGYGKRGSFEGFCSGGGIAEMGKIYALESFQAGKKVSFCKSIDDISSITTKKIAEKANDGEIDAINIFKESGYKLGKGLSIAIDILNPECIVIGSVFTRCEKLLRPYMEEIMKKESLSFSYNVCKVVPAKLGDEIGNYAALSVASMIK